MDMAIFSCCRSDTFRLLSRAAAKSASARWRQLGMSSIHPHWADRAQACERCPLRVISKGISYCGDPFLEKIHRDPQLDGCGCPTRAKAKGPKEHCPLDSHHMPAVQDSNGCNCKWCVLTPAQRTLVA